MVAAAGNSNADARNYCPANAKGVICVTAINDHKQLADFANDVSNIEMAVAAPGTKIYSTMPNDSYEAHTGTSMSAPFVSGLIGLMMYYKPDLTTKEVYNLSLIHI